MKYEAKTQLARAAVEKVVKGGNVLEAREEEVPTAWREKGACFVTLEVDDRLHGCIGTVEAYRPLYQDIIDNAVSAATRDWRFPPLTKKELAPGRLGVEVSVLSPQQLIQPMNNTALLKYLEANKPGLMIEKTGRRGVFLPQVWEDLAEPGSFLQHLCLKAGLLPDAWREGMTFWIFTVTAEKG